MFNFLFFIGFVLVFARDPVFWRLTFFTLIAAAVVLAVVRITGLDIPHM